MKPSSVSPPLFKWRCAEKAARQRGLSLIELLVGITIGLLVILAAISTLSFTRVSSLAVTDTVQMQQDATIAMEMIGRQLRQSRAVTVQETLPAAGTRDVSIVSYADFSGLTPPGVASPGQVAVYGIEGGADNSVPDSFTTSFGVSPIAGLSLNCLGRATTTLPDTLASHFNVDGNQLRCRPLDNDLASQAVISNVENLQVWYGVRDNILLDNIRYLRADEVGNQNWGTVDSVMVCLQLSGTTTNVPRPPGFVQQGCDGVNIAWDGRYRKVYRQVFALRNLAAG